MFIQRDPATVSNRDNSVVAPSITPDKEEAVRADLLRQIETSQRELETQLAALRYAGRDHDLVDQGEANLRRLNLLRDQLVGGAKGVAALRAEVSSAVAATHAYTSSVSGTAGAAGAAHAASAEQVALSRASDAAHWTVADFSRDFFERKIFDHDLKFASTEDEEAYRQREEARRHAIEAAYAESTPESNLRAIRLEIDQLHDAGAHGATRNGEYKRWDEALSARQTALQAAIDNAKSPKPATAKASDVDAIAVAANVSPDLLAGFRGAGIVLADQNGSGHGVAVRDGKGADRQVAPPH